VPKSTSLFERTSNPERHGGLFDDDLVDADALPPLGDCAIEQLEQLMSH
jgi:hypothetical protein